MQKIKNILHELRFFFISNQLHALFSLFLMNINDVVISNFVEFAKLLHANDRFDRIILNEIHLLFIVSHFRQRMFFVLQLRKIVVFFICLIVIFSFFAKLNFKHLLHFIRCEIMRINNDRSNLKFCVQLISSFKNRLSKNHRFIHETTKICMQNMKS